MKSIYDGMLKAFKRGLKSAIENEGRVFVTVKTELPVEEKTPLTCQFRKIHQNVRLPERNGAAWDLYLPEDVHIEAGRAKPASGEMAEWTIAPALKAGERFGVPEVRILLSPL